MAIVQSVNCTYASVAAAVASANSGDIVVIPGGSATWASQLVVNKPIQIIGADRNTTFITSGYTAPNQGNNLNPANFLIAYQPTADVLNGIFRVSSISFDFNNTCGGICLYNYRTTPVRYARVDNNIITNAYYAGGTARAIEALGTVYGVVDHNTFSANTGAPKFIDSYGDEAASWNSLAYVPGSIDNLYYEDNTFTITVCPSSGGAGGRYCARYNTYTYTPNSDLSPWFDMHGNLGVGNSYGIMGAEIYGNLLISSNNRGIDFVDQRGGKAMIFGNKAQTTADCTFRAREEVDDNLNPTTGSFPSGNCQIDGTPQHVNGSYFWNNRHNATVVTVDFTQNTRKTSGTLATANDYTIVEYHAGDDFTNIGASRNANGVQFVATGTTPANWTNGSILGASYLVTADRDAFDFAPSFDGSTGCGAGPLASRPASCALVGAGYWATDQDVSQVPAASVGANPATPLSGILYLWNGSGWVNYYTPLPYPHPLVTGLKPYLFGR